ncbi:MAG: PGPGW domain-containing protein [Patescibacteria group bacterium]|nr:PGPGW domain-containing protein [Patescibacteria group bacterium]
MQANDGLLFVLTTVSALVFVATLLAVPWFAARIPQDYFAPGRRHRPPWADQHPARRALLMVGKNLVGAVFVVVGLALLVLPGQGLLTILAGIILLDFPGKRRLERWVIGRRPVLQSINWLRRRAGRPPLTVG